MHTIRLRKNELRSLQTSPPYSDPLTKMQYLEKWFCEQIGKPYEKTVIGYGDKHFKEELIDILYKKPVITANKILYNTILEYRKGISYLPEIRF